MSINFEGIVNGTSNKLFRSPHVFTNLKIFKQFFTVIIRNIIGNLNSYLRVFTILIQLHAKP